MIFIYNCFGGTHTSSLASAIHLKKLPYDTVPTSEQILGTDYFNKLTYKDFGRIIYRGADEDGNKVYTIGRGTSKVLIPGLKNLITILHDECSLNEKIIFSNMSPTVPLVMTIGFILKKTLRIVFTPLCSSFKTSVAFIVTDQLYHKRKTPFYWGSSLGDWS